MRRGGLSLPRENELEMDLSLSEALVRLQEERKLARDAHVAADLTQDVWLKT